jgi:pimeloyl-ACP methyl ester carboxylesterase
MVFLPLNVYKPPVIVSGDLCWFNWGDSLINIWPQKGLSLVARGYALIQFDRTSLQADEKDILSGAKALYPNFDWGNIAIWAWGYQRVVDYIFLSDLFDVKKIVVTGHSRGGKATLLAGAFDERIAVIVPNGSGTSGSGSIRCQFFDSVKSLDMKKVPQLYRSESIDDILNNFPYWFNARFAEFSGKNANKLPFDQDALIALIAPRAYLCTYAKNDVWANPFGSEKAFLSAKKVFGFLNAENNIRFHYREGGHEQTLEDWKVLFNFCDLIFYKKDTNQVYDNLLYHK